MPQILGLGHLDVIQSNHFINKNTSKHTYATTNDGSYRLTVWQSRDDFGCHPVRSAHQRLALRQLRRYLCTEPEVGQFHLHPAYQLFVINIMARFTQSAQSMLIYGHIARIGRGLHWLHHLVNDYRSVCGGNAALSQITL